MDRIIEFFKSENMYDEEIFNYIKERTHIYPSSTDIPFFGCYPKVKNSVLVDFNLIIPEIKTLKNLLVSIHEFTHALDLYPELGKYYVETNQKIKEREERAKYMEKRYIEKSLSGDFINENKGKQM